MGKVILTMSMSVDGFIRAADPTPDAPLGQGGERLHEWAFGDPAGAEFLKKSIAGIGAVVTGRKNYDDSLRWWGADGPTGPARLPLFVITHEPPGTSPENGVYHFVGSVSEAVAQAKRAGGGKDVSIMGGPNVGNQALRAGLVDEILISIAPVLFGDGTRFFEQLPQHVELDKLAVVDHRNATHVHYRIVRR